MDDWELIVVDDGSVPRLTGIQSSPRLKIVRHDVSRGVSAARNAGLERARGKWVAFLDDDDLWAPTKLEVQIAALERAEVGFSYTSSLYVNTDGRLRAPRPAFTPEDLRLELMSYNPVGEPSTVVVSRELMQELGGFDTRLAITADWDMWLRLSARTEATALEAVTTAILEHNDSMQVVQVERIVGELEIMRQRHSELLAEHGRDLRSPEIALWIASKRWTAAPSVRSAQEFLASALRVHGLWGTMRRVSQQGLGRRRMAPDWVLELLWDAPSVPAIPTAHPSHPGVSESTTTARIDDW